MSGEDFYPQTIPFKTDAKYTKRSSHYALKPRLHKTAVTCRFILLNRYYFIYLSRVNWYEQIITLKLTHMNIFKVAGLLISIASLILTTLEEESKKSEKDKSYEN